MKRGRIAFAAGWLAVVVALVWTIHERQVVGSATVDRLAAEAELQQVSAETAKLVTRTRQMNAQLEAAAHRPIAHPAPASIQRRSPMTPADWAARTRVMQRAGIELSIQVLCHRLGLSAEAAQKLVALLQESRERGTDVFVAARDNHVDPMSAGVKPMLDEEEARLRQRITSELGPDVAKAYFDPQRMAGETAAGDIAADLCFSDHPLSTQQAEAIAAAVDQLPSGSITGVLGLELSAVGGSQFMSGSPEAIARISDQLERAAAASQTMLAQLAPEQAAIVQNRMQAAELLYWTSANAYATWRAIRHGAPVPALLPGP